MTDTYEMLEARQLMAAEQYTEALSVLDKTPAEERTAPWYYLRSQIEEKQACYYNSVTSLKMAVKFSPENKEYQDALKAMQKRLRKDTAKHPQTAAGMAVGAGSVCNCFRKENSRQCCEACGEGCCESICEAGCDNCDCDCG